MAQSKQVFISVLLNLAHLILAYNLIVRHVVLGPIGSGHCEAFSSATLSVTNRSCQKQLWNFHPLQATAPGTWHPAKAQRSHQSRFESPPAQLMLE